MNWLLLTCLPIHRFEQVSLRRQWYTARWEIESVCRVLKPGGKIETLPVDTAKCLAVGLACYLLIAWRVRYVTRLGRESPNLEGEARFDKAEWQMLDIVAKREPPPEEPPLLSVRVLRLAKLGGCLGRKQDGFPGPQPLWIGLQRVRDYLWAIQSYQLARSIAYTRQRERCV